MGVFKKKGGGLSKFGSLFVSKKDPNKSSVFGSIIGVASDLVGFVVPGGGLASKGTSKLISTATKIASSGVVKATSSVVKSTLANELLNAKQENLTIQEQKKAQGVNQLGESTETYKKEVESKFNMQNIVLILCGALGLLWIIKKK